MNTAIFELECCCHCQAEKVFAAFEKNFSDDSDLKITERRLTVKSDEPLNDMIARLASANISVKVIHFQEEIYDE
jgi:hypothetical protein